jgi:hypothetical protein
MKFEDLLQRTRRDQPHLSASSFPTRLLALDPGRTTGWAFFHNGTYYRSGTVVGNAKQVKKLLDDSRPEVVVIESYRIYASKAQQHVHSDVPTLQLIGALKYICETHVPPIPVVFQTAAQGKGFSSDDKLKEWGFWPSGPGAVHARDAIRHATHFLLFGTKP